MAEIFVAFHMQLPKHTCNVFYPLVLWKPLVSVAKCVVINIMNNIVWKTAPNSPVLGHKYHLQPLISCRVGHVTLPEVVKSQGHLQCALGFTSANKGINRESSIFVSFLDCSQLSKIFRIRDLLISWQTFKKHSLRTGCPGDKNMQSSGPQRLGRLDSYSVPLSSQYICHGNGLQKVLYVRKKGKKEAYQTEEDDKFLTKDAWQIQIRDCEELQCLRQI